MSSCPNTAPEIICQLCGLHYMPSSGESTCASVVMCNNHFKRWLKEEPEVQKIHKEWKNGDKDEKH